MITLLLATHILLMSISLFATMATVFASVLGNRVHKLVIAGNAIGTSLGLLCGSILLLSAPLDAKCITLGAYLLAFAGAQLYIVRRNQRLLSSARV